MPQRRAHNREMVDASTSTAESEALRASERAARRRAREQRQAHAAEDTQRAWWHPSFGKVLLLAALLAAVVFLAQLCSTASSINVTVNGTQYALRGEKTLEVALKESGLPVNPGDLISLGGAILERRAGDPFYATVNDQEVDDPKYKLRDGDVVNLSDGKDVVEPYDAVESAVPFGVSIIGLGPIHTFSPGTDGVMETRTGQISGEVVEKQTVDPIDLTETRAEPSVEGRKVIALTFDNGPSDPYTGQILDILAKNKAKATFFCLGESIDLLGPDLVKREADEGHQVLTHSYDNALVASGEMGGLPIDQQLDQLEHGLRTVADAIGYEPARYVRLGDKDLDETSVLALSSSIDAEIGWTLDTGDWVYMSEDQIYDVLMSAKSGDVVRMHDGGGSQESTVAALKRALPRLAKKGFSFVTIDELIDGSSSGSENSEAASN